jgi:hypothetical protein
MLPGIALPVIQATTLPQPPTVVPEWGHPLLTPDGKTIRVPASAFAKLRRLGAFLGKSNRLSPRIYDLMKPEFACIIEGLVRLLGEDLSGPNWVQCTCKSCQDKKSGSDHTRLPGRNPFDDDRISVLVREIVHKRKYS